MNKWEKFLSSEMDIELKASLYFYTILFFYFALRILGGSLQADIIVIIEMMITTYGMGFLQVYLLDNFDESECFTWKEALKVLGCSLLYVIISYLGNWFERDLVIMGVFLVFMFGCYGCVYWFYSVKRAINTKEMNKELETFKQQRIRKS